MADLSKMTAVAEVYESDVERLAAWVHAGPVKAEVKNPALPHPLNGVVKSDQDIARMIAKNQVFAMGRAKTPIAASFRSLSILILRLPPTPAGSSACK